ncbi:MAG: hypothetical protein AAFQ19_15605 [Pseudomonadota bacterium]
MTETRVNLVDGGFPAGGSMTVSHLGLRKGGGANLIFGNSIVRADTAAAARAMGKGCPMGVDGFGTVAVALNIDI